MLAKNISAVFERLGYGADAGAEVFAALIDCLKKKRVSVSERSLRESLDASDSDDEEEARGPMATLADIASVDFNSDDDNVTENIVAKPATAVDTDYRMNFKDFMDCATEIDDILVQSILLSTRRRMLTALKEGNAAISAATSPR